MAARKRWEKRGLRSLNEWQENIAKVKIIEDLRREVGEKMEIKPVE